MTTDQLVDWMAGHRWKPGTRRVARNALRAYFRWAKRVGRVRLDNPAEDLDPIRLTPPCPKPVPEDALRAALSNADPTTWLMVALGAFCGLRHRYASTIYRRTGDLLVLGELLGHSSPATTKVYCQTNTDDLRRVAATAAL